MKVRIGLMALALLLAVGISRGEEKKACCVMGKGAMPTKAICVLSSASGSSVSGWVSFEQKGDDLRVKGEIKGLSPGDHGFHVHEFGDCSAADAASAGGHFNPMGEAHGAPGAKEHHMGDLGNVKADSNGVAKIDRKVKGAMVCSILGRAVIVHGKADDLKSQPAGNAGPRVGCGVIGVATTEAKK